MATIRKTRRITQSQPTLEGAGVKLHRAFGFRETSLFDPFLLLDDFRGDRPEDYQAGFPWHPHRGIETITYVLAGSVEHGDSLGNKGVISSGDVQWMTAGSGIIHQEMPSGAPDGKMYGFQLWANLPATQKMMAPRYRDIQADQIPVIDHNGIQIRVICGRIGAVQGPVRDIVIEPEYLDVSMPPNTTFQHATRPGHTVLAYVFEGSALFGPDPASPLGNRSLVLLDDGDEACVRTAESPARFLLVSGKPLKEPVAWYGPIVMNTDEEIREALKEYRNGTFVKEGTFIRE